MFSPNSQAELMTPSSVSGLHITLDFASNIFFLISICISDSSTENKLLWGSDSVFVIQFLSVWHHISGAQEALNQLVGLSVLALVVTTSAPELC